MPTFYMKLPLIFLFRNFPGVLFAYLIKEDVQTVLLLFARKPWRTDITLWAVVPTLRRSHLSWSKNHRRLLSQSVALLTMGRWGTCPPSSLGNSVHSAAAASLNCKYFEKYQRKTGIKLSSISPETR